MRTGRDRAWKWWVRVYRGLGASAAAAGFFRFPGRFTPFKNCITPTDKKNKNNSINIRMTTKTNTRTNKNTNKTMKIKSKKFSKRIYLYSTPRIAQRMAYKYLGRIKTAKLYPARNPAKKYMVFDPKNNKWVNFGQMGYEDYTKHHDKTRRKNYLTRTKGMLGDWKSNKYSANNLSRNILW